MDETSQTIALVRFTIISGVAYLPKMKKKRLTKKKQN
jgi:hypothetical protein